MGNGFRDVGQAGERERERGRRRGREREGGEEGRRRPAAEGAAFESRNPFCSEAAVVKWNRSNCTELQGYWPIQIGQIEPIELSRRAIGLSDRDIRIVIGHNAGSKKSGIFQTDTMLG